jgi:hypothetical protein
MDTLERTNIFLKAILILINFYRNMGYEKCYCKKFVKFRKFFAENPKIPSTFLKKMDIPNPEEKRKPNKMKRMVKFKFFLIITEHFS